MNVGRGVKNPNGLYKYIDSTKEFLISSLPPPTPLTYRKIPSICKKLMEILRVLSPKITQSNFTKN